MIAPAIIPRSRADLEMKLALVAFAPRVQIDVVDHSFNDQASWPYVPPGRPSDVKDHLKLTTVEVDLMAEEAVTAGREWLLNGAKALVFHLENLTDPEAAVDLRKDFDLELGFAIGNDTPLEYLYPHIEQIDFVQLMGIGNIGLQGQPFDPRVLGRIATLRHLYPNLVISIDGGVNADTIRELQAAGANRFVVGSAILQAKQPEQSYRHLLKIIAASGYGRV